MVLDTVIVAPAKATRSYDYGNDFYDMIRIPYDDDPRDPLSISLTGLLASDSSHMPWALLHIYYSSLVLTQQSGANNLVVSYVSYFYSPIPFLALRTIHPKVLCRTGITWIA